MELEQHVDEGWRPAVQAAVSALEPFVEEAAEWAASEVARRWPELTRETVLPALERNLERADDRSGRRQNRQKSGAQDTSIRSAALTGALAAAAGAAGLAFLRR